MPDLADADVPRSDGHQSAGPSASKKPPLGPSAPSVAARTATFAPSDAPRSSPDALFVAHVEVDETDVSVIREVLRRGFAALLVATPQPDGETPPSEPTRGLQPDALVGAREERRLLCGIHEP